MADEQELEKLLNVSLQKKLEGLAILYWDEIYGGKFLATVDFGDLPKFAEYALEAMGYEQVWDKCPECKGRGIRFNIAERVEWDCPTCNGTGEKKLDSPDREQERESTASMFGYIEDMFPELDDSYWRGKRWNDFKQEQLGQGLKGE